MAIIPLYMLIPTVYRSTLHAIFASMKFRMCLENYVHFVNKYVCTQRHTHTHTHWLLECDHNLLGVPRAVMVFEMCRLSKCFHKFKDC